MIKHAKKPSIDRSLSVPLYKQIKEILIEELQAADGESGRPFSTEQDLVQRFHVSRAPVRQALKELTDEGYVYRERAKGTFPVQDLPVRPPGLELGGLIGFLRDQGLDCSSKILGIDRVLPTENLCANLGLVSTDKVLRTSRLILLKEKPLVWAQTLLFVSGDFHPTKQELNTVDSIFSLLQSEQGVFISRGDHQIFSSCANPKEAELLNVQKSDPILVIETKLYTRNDRLIGWRRAVHRADEYKFSFTVNR